MSEHRKRIIRAQASWRDKVGDALIRLGHCVRKSEDWGPDRIVVGATVYPAPDVTADEFSRMRTVYGTLDGWQS